VGLSRIRGQQKGVLLSFGYAVGREINTTVRKKKIEAKE